MTDVCVLRACKCLRTNIAHYYVTKNLILTFIILILAASKSTIVHHHCFGWLKRQFSIIPIIVVMTVFSCSSAKAQRNSSSDSQYGVSIGSDYDAPVGNFAYTFKPAINYNLNLLRHSGDFTMNLSFGYHMYKPKQDTFYYQASATEYGKVSYQNFPVYSFYLGLIYNLPITDQLKIYTGFNLGAYNTHFVFVATDFLVDDHEDLHEQDLYLAPRLGVAYMIDNHLGIGLEGKYNLFAPTGDSQYNSRVGTLYNSYSVGGRLIYNF